MKSITAITSKGKQEFHHPESWDETTVDQYQQFIPQWKHLLEEDWVKLFSIFSGIDASAIAESTDEKLSAALYRTIEFAFTPFDESAPVPDTLELRTIWESDNPAPPVTVTLPKTLGQFSIGQAIQARRSIEGLTDIREGLSIVTAIYLQPLIDGGKFDMLKVVPLEYTIKRMPITKIYPLGFFLLRKLNDYGPRPTGIWHQIKRFLRM